MEAEVGEAGGLSTNGPARRANRRLNGMGTKAGVPDPPKRGKLMRTLALVDAAIRVWETNNRQKRAPVLRNRFE
jgi:hypothetical protein